MPQIEVQFDIDANGILHVRERQGHRQGKQDHHQGQLGLSEEEIQRMVNDAKANEAEDKKRLELVQSRNNLDTLAHSVKKSLGEYGDKIEADEKSKIEAALKETEKSC